MAGPTPMLLGPFAFEALGFGFENINRDLDTKWAEVPVAFSLDQLQWTGPKSDKVEIRGVLFPESHGGQSQLNGIASAAQAGQVLPLISGNAAGGDIHGSFVVEAIGEDRGYIDASGQPRRNAYVITIKRKSGGDGGSGLFGQFLSLFG